MVSAHHRRNTSRTLLTELGALPDQAGLLVGYSLGGDVNRGCITPPLLLESISYLLAHEMLHVAARMNDADLRKQFGLTPETNLTEWLANDCKHCKL